MYLKRYFQIFDFLVYSGGQLLKHQVGFSLVEMIKMSVQQMDLVDSIGVELYYIKYVNGLALFLIFNV